MSDGISRVREQLKTLFLSSGLDSRNAYASVALWQGNHIRHELIAFQDNACGMATAPKQQFVQKKQFLIYSLTKTILATLVLKRVERSEIELDQNIARWFADVPAASTITIRQLLTHTSGLPDYGTLREYHQAVRSSPGHPWSEAEFLERSLAQGLQFEPGSKSSYSNIGYLLLRRIVERISSKSFADIVLEELLIPLNLQDTFVPVTKQDLSVIAPGWSTYLTDDQKVVDVRASYHPGWVAHGVIASTALDIARFYHALFAGQLLSQVLLNEMTTVVATEGSSYGMGLTIGTHPKFGLVRGHSGEGPGFSAAVCQFELKETAPILSVVLMNMECTKEAIALVYEQAKPLTGNYPP